MNATPFIISAQDKKQKVMEARLTQENERHGFNGKSQRRRGVLCV